MISTRLPDIQTFNYQPPELEDNIVLFANSQTKYYYPEHKTPFLFITNFLGTGRYNVNKRKINVLDKYFYFLNKNDNLEIDFRKNNPMQTLFILFKTEFVNDIFSYLLQSDDQLLKSPQIPETVITVPTVPYIFNTVMLNNISLLLKSYYYLILKCKSMKKLTIVLCLVIAACSSSQKSRFDFVDHEIEKGKEPGNMFVVKNDGEKISGTISQPKGFVKSQVYLLMDGTRINFKDIKDYQDSSGYHAFLKDKDHKLGIFVDRLRFGKINFYMQQQLISNGPNTATNFFYNYFFNKGNQQIVAIDYNT